AAATSAPAPKPNPDVWVLTVKAPTRELRAEYTRVVAEVCRGHPLSSAAHGAARGDRGLPSLKGVYYQARAIKEALKVPGDERAGAVRVDLRGWPAAERPALKAALQKGWDAHLVGLSSILAKLAKWRADGS